MRGYVGSALVVVARASEAMVWVMSLILIGRPATPEARSRGTKVKIQNVEMNERILAVFDG